jgi:uncharacterized membrane protein
VEGVVRDQAWSFDEVVGSAAFGPVSGWIILAGVLAFYCWLVYAALRRDVETVEATYGEVHV